MITTIREVQAPLLSLLLLGACAAKLLRVLRAGSVSAGLGPTDLFPLRLRRPAAIALCATEFGLGVLLILTAGRSGAGGRADAVRLSTALLFLVAMCALVELRERRPDLGCGCFGGLSTRPAGVRTIVRAGFLAGAALAGTGIPPLRLPPPGPRAAACFGILIAELVLVAVLSPEVGEALVRLGYSEPCELRAVPTQRALATLRRSRVWRRHSGQLTSDVPADVWRELCWWYAVFPARSDGQDGELVFALQVKQRRPAIHSALVLSRPPSPALPPGIQAGQLAPPISSATL